MTRPLITIGLTTYNAADTVERALRSALAQTGVDPATLELIVADNDQQPSARLAGSLV